MKLLAKQLDQFSKAKTDTVNLLIQSITD